MGTLIWHELGSIVSISAGAYSVWASFWGIFFRKFFWDFIGGTVRNPGGIQPSPRARPFIIPIVQVPLVQIACMLVGISVLALECRYRASAGYALQRSLLMRVLLLVLQACLAVLFYQGTNAALWSLIAVAIYLRAIARGEQIGHKPQFGSADQP